MAFKTYWGSCSVENSLIIEIVKVLMYQKSYRVYLLEPYGSSCEGLCVQPVADSYWLDYTYCHLNIFGTISYNEFNITCCLIASRLSSQQKIFSGNSWACICSIT